MYNVHLRIFSFLSSHFSPSPLTPQIPFHTVIIEQRYGCVISTDSRLDLQLGNKCKGKAIKNRIYYSLEFKKKKKIYNSCFSPFSGGLKPKNLNRKQLKVDLKFNYLKIKLLLNNRTGLKIGNRFYTVISEHTKQKIISNGEKKKKNFKASN